MRSKKKNCVTQNDAWCKLAAFIGHVLSRLEREKCGREKDREAGRGRELPAIPDEEADMSKSNTMTGESWGVWC